MYLSPLRKETSPSFSVNPTKNVWYDFGLGEGGDAIKLESMLTGATFREAIARLADEEALAETPVQQSSREIPLQESPQQTAEIIDTRPIAHPTLTNYLKVRAIPVASAKTLFEELRYRRGHRGFLALAMPNDSHTVDHSSYEIRDPTFKGTIGRKDIRYLRSGSDRLHIFEGSFDYLSARELGWVPAEDSVIILNSVGMRERAITACMDSLPDAIHLWLDHDDAGDRITSRFFAEFGDEGIATIDERPRYASHPDVNDFLIASQAVRTQAFRAHTGSIELTR